MRHRRSMMLGACAGIALAPPSLSLAQGAAAGCWQRPPAHSLVEASRISENRSQYRLRQNRAQARRPAALLLSNGHQKTAFAAGHLAGWSETGRRPQFDWVTAVGPSAMLAPFAFVGIAGDRSIADLFACAAGDWQTMARRAAAMVDPATISEIARRHRAGRRLLIAIQGNAARASAAWDIGWIAVHRRASLTVALQEIFTAAIDRSATPDPKLVPPAAARSLPRNHAFRHLGAGLAVLPPDTPTKRLRSIYVLHNGVLRADDATDFAAKLRRNAIRRPASGRLSLRTVYHVRTAAASAGVTLHLASIKRRRWLFPASLFDPRYMRLLFDKAHRAARLGRLWQLRVGPESTRDGRPGALR